MAQPPQQNANWGSASNWDGDATPKQAASSVPLPGSKEVNPYAQPAGSQETSWDALRRKNGDDWEAVRRAQRPQ